MKGDTPAKMERALEIRGRKGRKAKMVTEEQNGYTKKDPV